MRTGSLHDSVLPDRFTAGGCAESVTTLSSASGPYAHALVRIDIRPALALNLAVSAPRQDWYCDTGQSFTQWKGQRDRCTARDSGVNAQLATHFACKLARLVGTDTHTLISLGRVKRTK